MKRRKPQKRQIRGLNQHADTFAHRNTKRNKSRAEQRRRALAEWGV